MSEKRETTRHDAGFTTTNWSLVLGAGDANNPQKSVALEALCRIYWIPVYGYVRRRLGDVERAQDSTQAFFVFLLEKGLVGKANPERGRFRSFLLSSVKNFLTNEWDRETARKRGSGRQPLSLDFESAERVYRLEPANDETPETVFARQWAHTLLDRTFHRLECEMEQAGRVRRFEELRPFLVGDADGTYEQAAAALDMSVSAVKVAVFRMRRRFGALLREEVGQLIQDPNEVDAEIHFLFDALGRG